MSKVAEAVKLAASAFKSVVDKNGEPYLAHCIRVAIYSQAAMQSWLRIKVSAEDVACVALLHDVLEDFEVSVEKLLDDFGRVVTSEIIMLTRLQGESYEKYINDVSHNRIASIVKWADLKDNLDPDRLKLLDENTKQKLIKKYMSAEKTITNALNRFNGHEEF